MSDPIRTELVASFDAKQHPASDLADPITRAEIDQAIATAKQWPRDLGRFRDDVMSMATIDEEVAADCYYSFRRGGKTIQGESVRLAEIALSCWGNIRAGARIMGESPNGKTVRALGICHDLEKNVYVAMEAERRITNKSGKRFNEDMIAVTTNAAAAIGFRNAIFRIIPRIYLRAVFRKCIEVATGGASTLGEKRQRVIERLARLNPAITEGRILATMEKTSVEAITLDDVAHLIGLGTAIKDGAITIEEAFPEPKASSQSIVSGSELEPAIGSGDEITLDDRRMESEEMLYGVERGPEPEPKAKPEADLMIEPIRNELVRDLTKLDRIENAIMHCGPPDRWKKKDEEPLKAMLRGSKG